MDDSGKDKGINGLAIGLILVALVIGVAGGVAADRFLFKKEKEEENRQDEEKTAEE